MSRPVTTTFRRVPSAQIGRAGYHERSPSPNAHVAASLIFLFGAFWPRLIVGFSIFRNEIGDAFSSPVTPAIGFLVLPWTMLSHAITAAVADGERIFVGIGVLPDLGTCLAASRLRS